jgi:hypothetical protein
MRSLTISSAILLFLAASAAAEETPSPPSAEEVEAGYMIRVGDLERAYGQLEQRYIAVKKELDKLQAEKAAAERGKP